MVARGPRAPFNLVNQREIVIAFLFPAWPTRLLKAELVPLHDRRSNHLIGNYRESVPPGSLTESWMHVADKPE